MVDAERSKVQNSLHCRYPSNLKSTTDDLHQWPSLMALISCLHHRAEIMLTIEQNTKLLKLYTQWPGRSQFRGSPGEALLFYKWLFQQHSQRAEVQALDSTDDVSAFLKTNSRLFSADTGSQRADNHRREPRLPSHVQLLINVSESSSNIGMVGIATHGQAIDIGLHGLRLKSDRILPKDSVLSLTISPEGFPVTIYNLVADARWVAEGHEGFMMGVQIVEAGDFDRWKSEFGARFVAPTVKARK